MTADVVPFAPRPPAAEPEADLVLRCVSCGCLTHYLLDDGRVECALCLAPVDHSSGDWRAGLPPRPAEPAPPEPGDPEIKVYPEVKMAARSVARSALDALGLDDLALLVVVTKSGVTRVWDDLHRDPDHLGWLDEKLAAARDLVFPPAGATDE